MKLILLAGSCGSLSLVQSNWQFPNPWTPEQTLQKPVKSAQSRLGMVVTGSPEATAAGRRILENGGNAIDAAVAAHLALMVTDPANTSLGGRAQILLRLRGGRIIALDGATQIPTAVDPLRANEERRGYKVVPVPGNLAVLAEMVRRFGRLKPSALILPAIELAENGFKVPPRLATAWSRNREALLEDPGATQNFLKPDGSAYQAGEIFIQPRLARTLQELAESGLTSFYQDETADAIARDVASRGGFLRKTDLANYRVKPGVVVQTSYRGFQVRAAGGRA